MKSKCKFKLGFFAVLMLASLAVSAPHYFPALICSVVIHESGHLVMARLLKIPMYELKLGIFGASLVPSNTLFSYTDEILLCLFGPLFNFLSVPMAFYFFKIPVSSMFTLSSLALGFLNLLPISGFDGGRIISAILHRLLCADLARRIARVISFVFIFSLWCVSVYFIMRVGASLSLFVFSVSVFAKIFIPDVC